MLVYKDWFKGKSVAVVGNAQSLFDREYGQIIDSHDVVCRINKGFYNIVDLSHGTRTDVLVFSQWATVRRAVKRKSALCIKYFIHTSALGREVIIAPTELNLESEYTQCPIDVINDLKTKVLLTKKQSVSTGITFLEMLSNCEPKKVSIFGFDWKKTPTFYTPVDTIKPDPHDFEKEREYCNKLCTQRNIFILHH
jgi:hypothetical protein